MGKREHKKWTFSLEQSGTLIFLSVLFLSGGIIGCLFSRLSAGAADGSLVSYLVDYMETAQTGPIKREFWSTAWNELRDFLLIVFLGMTPFKGVGASAMLFLRGFFLSFSFGCLIQVFGAEGAFLGALLFLIPALFWGPTLFLAANRVISLSAPALIDGFGITFGLCGLLLCACIGVEYWMIPRLLKIAVHIVF